MLKGVAVGAATHHFCSRWGDVPTLSAKLHAQHMYSQVGQRRVDEWSDGSVGRVIVSTIWVLTSDPPEIKVS